MARLLNCDKYGVVGRLAEFWAWTDDVSVDGSVDGVVDADVDALVSTNGFAAALEAVNWALFDREKNVLHLPNFSRHNGETSKKRALRNARQSKWRNAHVDGGASTKASTREDIKKNKKNAKQKIPKPKITWTEQAGFDVPASFLAGFKTAYPGVDLAAQFARAHVWCLSNPGKRPRSDFPRFLNSWLGRAQADAPAKVSGEGRLREIMRGQA